MYRRWIGAPLALALGACGEESLRPVTTDPIAPASAARAAIVCDKSWTTAVSGDWYDPTRWSPSGVPALHDNVCFEAAGTYTVTLSQEPEIIGDMEIGNGVAVTFDGLQTVTSPDTRHIYIGALVLDRIGRLSTTGCATLSLADPLILDGNLTLGDSCLDLNWMRSIDITGILELEDTRLYLTGGGAAFRKRGDVSLTGSSSVTLFTTPTASPASVRLESGGLLGNGTVSFVNGPFGVSELVWTGGALPARATTTGAAQVHVAGLHLTLTGSALAGAIDVGCQPNLIPRVRGDIPAAADVGLISGWITTATCDFQRRAGSPAGTPVTIDGRLLVRSVSGAPLVARSGATVDNRGTITTTGGDIDVAVDQLVNRGTFVVGSRTQFGTTSTSLLQNLGLVTVAASPAMLSIERGTFEAAPGTRMIGALKLAAGTQLTGRGHVGGVTSVGGTISPGPSLGALTMDALTLDAASRVRLDIAGTTPGAYDRLVVNGVASYNGTLEAPPLGTFDPGICGQVIPVITDGTSKAGLPRGRFATFAGTPSGQPRAWRAHYPTDSVLLVGFDPKVDVGMTPQSFALGEGGASVPASVCLGPKAPLVKVDVANGSLRGQFTFAPRTLSFLPTNWALPQPLVLAAVDDAVGEGPHSDVLTRRIVSTDAWYAGRAVPDVPVSITDNDPGADLTVALVIAGNATVGGHLDARFRVTNNGPAASTGATFTLTPMSGIEFGGVFTPGVSCTTATGVVTCTLGSLAAGASLELSFDFAAVAAGVHANTARVTGLGYDHVAGNDATVWNLTVNP